MMRTRTTLLVVALATVLAACGDSADPGSGGPTATATATSAASATAAPTTSPTSTPPAGGSINNIAVYWVAESRGSFALYREFRRVPDAGGPIASAVAAMTRMTPLDPDYRTPWKPASRVTARQSGDAITVDLSADAVSGTQVGSELAARAVQQLVYTATAAAAQAGTPARTVRITIDGRAADAWGSVRFGEPTSRAPMADVQAHVWVTSPQQGATLPAGKVTFTGFGTSFEANFGWRVLRSTGAVVAKGFAMGGSMGTFGELSFSTRLAGGSYVVEISTDDPSGGAEGPGPAVDTKAFTVR